MKGNTEAVSQSVHPIEAREPWDLIAVDIMGPLPHTAQGNLYVVALTDVYTKWTLAFSLCMKTPRSVANILVQTIYTHGPPRRFVCGQGKPFVKQVCIL